MSKKHGVGLPNLAFEVDFDGSGCANTRIDPYVDPWDRISDREHRTWPSARHPKHEEFWADVLRLFRASRTCYVGGFVATAHGLVLNALREAFGKGLLGNPAEWDGEPNQRELLIVKQSIGAWRHVGDLLGRPRTVPEPAPPPVGDGFFLPTNLSLVEVPEEWRSLAGAGLAVLPGGPPTNPEWTWQLQVGPFLAPKLIVFDNPAAWVGMRRHPERVRDLAASDWPAESEPQEPTAPPSPPNEPGDLETVFEELLEVAARLDVAEIEISHLNEWVAGPNTLNQHPDFKGLVEIFSQRVEKIEGRLLALENPHLPAPAPPVEPPNGGGTGVTLVVARRPGAFFVSTSTDPYRTIDVKLVPARFTRLKISYRVDIPEDFDPEGKRVQFHSATWNGVGRADRGGGVVGFFALDGALERGLFRAGDAWDPAVAPFSKEQFRFGASPPGAYLVEQELGPGKNLLTLSVPGGPVLARAGGFVPTTTAPKRTLQLIFGYPNEDNPQERYSLGWVYSDLLVEVG